MQTLGFGTWPSIISAADVAGASPRFDGAAYAAGHTWWGESVAAEGGRIAVLRDGEPVFPAPWNARSKVHEYGGGAWTVNDEGVVFFVNAADQRVYRVDGSEPVALTPEAPESRFGNLTFQQGRVLAVRERHTRATVPERDIVAIDPAVQADPHRLVAGSDFLAQPRLSPDGKTLAWIAWDHPSMPWDAAELRVGALQDCVVSEWRAVSQSDATQAEWRGSELVFNDDVTGRWNLYALTNDVRPLAAADADTGGAMWGLGMSWFTVLDDARIVAVRTNGRDELVVIDGDTVTALDVPISADVSIEAAHGTRVLAFGASATAPMGLWEIDVDDPANARPVRGGAAPWPAEWLPVPRAVTFDGKHGDVHAFDYAPTNPDVVAPEGELPPYIVLAHGGPTGHSSGGVSAAVAFFTSRGIGVLDVNYGGSTGYGREYRERLNNAWGIVDIDDVLAAAQGLAASGAADPARLAVKGGSAGGLTVLGSLVRGGTFSAGISRYGVADLRSLAADTHDFEARYLDGLIGRLPEDEAVYLERSPLTHAARINVPVLLLQGDEDAVVPPSQSEAIQQALAANGVPHRYELYAGEGHGFRKSETIIAAAETELGFLATVFDFTPADVAPLTLD